MSELLLLRTELSHALRSRCARLYERESSCHRSKRAKMEEVKAQDVAGQINNSKFKEVIARLKKDKHLAADVEAIYKGNRKIRQNATNIANEIGVEKMAGGSLNQKKKMQQYQNTMMELRKKSLRAAKGEIDCIMINAAGSEKTCAKSHPFIPAEMEGEKYQLEPLILGHKAFVVVCDSTQLSGRNKTASRLLGMDAYGPVILVNVDENYVPVDMDLVEFKALLAQA